MLCYVNGFSYKVNKSEEWNLAQYGELDGGTARPPLAPALIVPYQADAMHCFTPSKHAEQK